jgi:membrane-associated phospholipid phosphatase
MTVETSLTETPLESPIPILPMTRARIAARWISRVACPPVLAVGGAVMSASEIASRAAWFWASFIVGFNILLPSAYILWLKRKGRVTDFDVFLREQRFWPYVVTLTCGAISWLVMAALHAPRLFVILSGASVGQGLIMFIINQRWKISAHAAGTAGIAVLMWQLLGASGAPILLIIPLVAWSRVRLGRHTLGQVIAGSAVGVTVYLLAFAIWY